MTIYDFIPGQSPILISIPHAGTKLPPELTDRMTPQALPLPDTDWFVDRLYAFAAHLGIGIIKARYARYVIDLNRPIDGARLYPGRPETGLCPLTLFDGDPVYQPGAAPEDGEIKERIERFWRPYHDRLEQELRRLHGLHGHVLLWDAHSIRSQVPLLFEGRLPDLNFGTDGGSSCTASLADAIVTEAQKDARFTSIVNGRFKGGYITRHYGRPDMKINTIQLEVSQRAYMSEAMPPAYDQGQADDICRLLERLMGAALVVAV